MTALVTTLVLSNPSLASAKRATAESRTSATTAAATVPSEPITSASAGAVSTLAGSGGATTSAGVGTAAGLAAPTATAIAGSALYVAAADALLRVTPADATTSVVAGTPGTATCADGATGTTSGMSGIRDIAANSTAVYSAGACGLRKTTVATGATITVPGVSVAVQAVALGPDGALYMTESGNSGEVERLDTTTNTWTVWRTFHDGCSGSVINGLAADAANLYVQTQDINCGYYTGNPRVQALPFGGGAATTVVSDPTMHLGPLSAAGGFVFYVHDVSVCAGNACYNGTPFLSGPRIVRVPVGGGTPKPLAGAGAGYVDAVGTDAWFGDVADVTSDGTSLYVADRSNNRLRRVNGTSALPAAQPSTVDNAAGVDKGAVTTIAGNDSGVTTAGVGTAAGFANGAGLAIDGRLAYVSNDDSISRVNLDDGTVTVMAGQPGQRATVDAADPQAVRIGTSGPLALDGHYLYSVGGGFLRRTNLVTGATSTVGAQNNGYSVFSGGVAVGPDGMLYTSDGRTQVFAVDPVTGVFTTFATFSDGGCSSSDMVIRGVAADSTGLYVTKGNVYCFGDVRNLIVRRIAFVDHQVSDYPIDATGQSVVGGTIASVGDSVYVGYYTINESGPVNVPNPRRLVRQRKAGGPAQVIAGAVNAESDGTGGAAGFADISQIASDGTDLYTIDHVGTSGHLRRVSQELPEVPTAQTFGVGSYDGEFAVNPTCVCADPVNTATGALSEVATDAAMSGAGTPFAFTRAYTSADTASGLLGRGWVTPFDARLTPQPDSGATVRLGTGQQLTFSRRPDGGYTAAPGGRATLTATPTGWSLRFMHGDRYTFDGAGLVTRIADARDVGLRIDTINGHPAQVTDAAGRAVALLYADGLLSRLTLPDGRYVDYGYTNGQLTSVTDLRRKTTQYGYDTAGRLNSITDPLGREVMHTDYDATTGRAVRQVDANGAVTTFGWDQANGTATMTDPRGGTWTETYLSNVLVQKRDPLGNTTKYRYDPDLNMTGVVDARGLVTTLTYDTRGNLLARTAPAPLGYRQTFTYSADNELLAETDARGNTTRYTYDRGLPVTVTDADGHQATVTYTTAGQPDLVTDVRGKVTDYDYDAAGNQTKVTSPAGEVTTRSYDLSGRLATETDPRGNVTGSNAATYTTTFTYDTADHLISRIDGRGAVTSWSYDDAGDRTSMTDAGGNAARWAYDASHQLRFTTAPRGGISELRYDTIGNITYSSTADGAVTTYGYDLAGRRSTMTAPNGNVSGATPAQATANTWTWQYDAAGNATSTSNPAAGSTTVTYDEINRRIAITDALGHSTTTAYDANSNVTRVTDALGNHTDNTYDKLNRPLTSVDARGNTTSYTYDEVGHPLTTTSARGGISGFTYDADGRLASETDPRGLAPGAVAADYTTRYAYDPAGDLTTITDPLGRITRHTYDPAGNRTSRVDGNGHTTTWRYDLLDRLTATVGADAPSTTFATTYGYDADGNQTTRTDPNGHRTGYEFDLAGRLTATTTPAGRRSTFGYDANGNVLTAVTPLGTATPTVGDGAINYQYDPLGRITAIDYSDATPDVSYTYDQRRLLSMSDGAGRGTAAETYAYDVADRLTAVARNGAGFTYTYDPAGNITRRVAPDGSVTDYTYDTDSNIASVTQAGQTTNYGYDIADRLATTTLPTGNGHIETRTYDRAGYLTTQSNTKGTTVLSRFTRSLDNVGNPITQTTTRGTSTTSEAYLYDAADRVTKVCYATSCTGATASIGYNYDPVGNRTTQTRTGVTSPGTTTYSYDADDGLTRTTVGTTATTYTYDANGHQTAAGATTSTYGLDDHLASTTSSRTTTSYTYDGNGVRLTAATNGAVATRYSWDTNGPLPQLALERDAANTLLRRYVNGVDTVSFASTAGTFYYHHDPIGSVTDVTSSTGAAQWQHTYEPFGGVRTETKIATKAPANPLRFAGEYLDTTGQYHLRARQYDPATGRFTGRDPLNASAAQPYTSAYAYADNRATVLTDPSGLFPCLFVRRFADGSCVGNGMLGDTGKAIVGVAKGTVGFAYDTIDSGLHPIRTVRGMYEACVAGINRYANDRVSGVAQCIDNVNPIAGIRRNYSNGLKLAARGCITEASDQLTRGVWGTGATTAVVLDGLGLLSDAASVAGGIDAAVVDIDQLSSGQLSSYTRYLKRLPKGADYPTITRLPDGSVQFSADVPATNIPGSYATFTKVIGEDGSTITYYKTTIAPDGSVVSVKVKYP
ncbi:MAG TPA: DUF6531 domain-containing protein [Mycobacteriales bacterium]|nr:DUF6531 domain-containing protein [Mycobacteriales bacterium]